jgi:hypothetical protein
VGTGQRIPHTHKLLYCLVRSLCCCSGDVAVDRREDPDPSLSELVLKGRGGEGR